jgi:hypothetical protein
LFLEGQQTCFWKASKLDSGRPLSLERSARLGGQKTAAALILNGRTPFLPARYRGPGALRIYEAAAKKLSAR